MYGAYTGHIQHAHIYLHTRSEVGLSILVKCPIENDYYFEALGDEWFTLGLVVCVCPHANTWNESRM